MDATAFSLWAASTYGVYRLTSLPVSAVYAATAYFAYHYIPNLLGFEPVAAKDAVWAIERDNNRMVIVSIGVFEHTSAQSMKSLLREKAFYGQKRARQYIRRIYGRTYWVEDEKFSFEDHFHVISTPVRSKAELCALASDLASRVFPANRPFWDFFFVSHYSADRSAVIFKFHHVLMDGLSAVSAITHCADANSSDVFYKLPKANWIKRLFASAVAVVVLPYWLWAWGELKDDQNPLHGAALSGGKSVFWTEPLSLAAIKSYCRLHSISLNDFLAAATLRTLRKCTQSTQDHTRFSLFLPISLRGLPEDGSALPLDNDFASLLLHMPAADSPDLEQECSKLFSSVKNSTEPMALALSTYLLGLLPMEAAGKMIFSVSDRATLVFSNVPGPRAGLKFGGAALEQLIAVAPASGTCGISVTTLSYQDKLTIACYTDKALLSEAKLMADCLSEEIEMSLRIG